MSLTTSKTSVQNLPATPPVEELISERIRSLMFPANLRIFPYRHWVLNILRAVHIAFLCPLVGGIVFGQDVSTLTPWLIGTLLSGLGIFAIDLYGSCIALFEVRGISVLIKLGLIGLLPLFNQDNQLLILVFLVFVSSLLSHSRRRLRHRSFMSRKFQRDYGFRDCANKPASPALQRP